MIRRIACASLLLASSLVVGCAHPLAGHGDATVSAAERIDGRPQTSFAPGADAARSERAPLSKKPSGASTDAHDVEVVDVMRAALRGNPNLAHYADSLTVSSENGGVHLAGAVASNADARFIAETAMEIASVDVVYADLVVAPATVSAARAKAASAARSSSGG